MESEEPPQYNIITEENQYEFIIWCDELRPPSISLFKFNMLVQINMEKWIYQNNITWQYAYANAVDTLKVQQEIENTMKQVQEKQVQEKQVQEKQQQEKEKPSDKIKRRELFAKKAEERQYRRKKRKSI